MSLRLFLLVFGVFFFLANINLKNVGCPGIEYLFTLTALIQIIIIKLKSSIIECLNRFPHL